MKLVIVESPAKAKTIEKYLGSDYKVRSSYGHVRDLPKSVIGIDVANDFKPKYVVPTKAKKAVAELKKLAKQADEIYLATDEDREGEAIAWHLKELLKPDPKKTKRISFNEITKTALTRAVENPRQINQELVDAQQARRILDRLVGYELSPLLWKKIRYGLSAGRVQSVAVRLVVEREEEIRAFKPQEYWSLIANLEHDSIPFEAKLTAHSDKKYKKHDLKNKEQVDQILDGLDQQTFTVTNIETKQRKRTPPPPFTTSTLQQSGVNQLGFSSARTMMTAQKLYESGHITYMRTDSVNLSQDALSAAQTAIKNSFGGDYGLAKPRFYKSKARNAQEAHEAIRPSDPTKTPDDLAQKLDPSQLKLYTLIWRRMIASQMAEALLNQLTVDISAGDYIFRASGSTVEFAGFSKALGAKAAFKETVLPKLEKNDQPNLKELKPEQHFTQPPARYSEATLVKALEEHEIGRPSTYAPTISTIEKRGYVIKNDDKRFEPTETGEIVNKLLKEHFPDIVDLDFTAEMEADLDSIADGSKKWQPILSDFYSPFHKLISKKDKEIKKEDITQEKIDEKCPKCNSELIIKLGRFGKFKACTGYPDCKHTEPIGEEKELEEELSDKTCPDCGKQLAVKRGRFGPFLGCSGYPDCKHIEKIEKKTGVSCPKCKEGEIIEKKSRKGKTFFACNRYPDCENAYWSKPTGKTCPDCESLLVYGAKNTIRCSEKDCGYKTKAE